MTLRSRQPGPGCVSANAYAGPAVVDARQSLRAALRTFDQLGARPWAQRARSELGVSGEPREHERTAAERLTAQELQVALVVARGASNRDTAAALFLSTKTIEFHLRNIYRKLGIGSRTELVRFLLHADRVPTMDRSRAGTGAVDDRARAAHTPPDHEH